MSYRFEIGVSSLRTKRKRFTNFKPRAERIAREMKKYYSNVYIHDKRNHKVRFV